MERGIAVVADSFVPTPDHDSASLRLVRLMELLGSFLDVVLMPAHQDRPAPAAVERMSALGVGVIATPAGQERFLADHGHRVRLALLSRPSSMTRFAGLVRTHAPAAVLAYDTVDLHHRRLDRQADLAAAEQRTDLVRLRAEAVSTRALEAYLASVADVTIAVSDEDAAGIRCLVPEADVRVISNVHPASPRAAQPDTAVLSFVGHYSHAPNVDGVLWFLDEVLPHILSEVPSAVVEILGDGPPAHLRARDSNSVRVRGWVADLDEALSETAVGLAPLRFGAGVKGKIGEMARRGIPVVSTRVGVEGMALDHGTHVLIGDTAVDFAAHVVTLLTHRGRAERMGRAAAARVDEQFGRGAAARELERLLTS